MLKTPVTGLGLRSHLEHDVDVMFPFAILYEYFSAVYSCAPA